MTLCDVCTALELGYRPPPQDEDGDCPNKWYTAPPRVDIDLDLTIYCLGTWSQITQSAHDGCGSCLFFLNCIRLQDSENNHMEVPLYLEHDYQHALQWDLTATLPSWLQGALSTQVGPSQDLQRSSTRGWKFDRTLHLDKEQVSEILFNPTRDRSMQIFGKPIMLELCRPLGRS